jgi:predicted HTH transcriptional regulator
LLVNGERLSRAAVVLFCKADDPLPDYPQLLLKVARFKGVNRDEFLDNRQFHGNAFALMRRAERFLIESLPVAGRILPDRMEREDTPLLPVEALRETLANAFVHRDYAIGGGSVSVALYDDRLEIISIGDLHFGLTPEALFREHESRPWNPMVARAFYLRGIIETWGRGTLKVARLMREAGLEPPRVSVRAGAVVVTFDLPQAKGTELPEKGTELPEKGTELPEKGTELPVFLTPDTLPDKLREQLESVAFKPRRQLWLSSVEMDEVVIRLCHGQALGLRVLAKLANRKEDYLRIKVLPRLIKSGRLRVLYPESPNDPRQAYTSVPRNP